MSRYFQNRDFDWAAVPELYAKGQFAYLRGPRGVDPEPYKIYQVLGDGQYKLSRNGKSDGEIYREEDLIEDHGYGGGRQSREVVRPAKRRNPRVNTSPDLKPQDSGREKGLVAPTGYQSGTLSVQELDGTTQMKFEPGLPRLSDRSHLTGDDDRSPETRSREASLSLTAKNLWQERVNKLSKKREEQAMVREKQAKAFEMEIKSYKRSDFQGSLAKPLKMEREEVDPNVFYGEFGVGGLKMPFTKTKSEDGVQDVAREPFSEIESEDSLQDLAQEPFSEIKSEDSLQELAGDTTTATGPGTKRDWTGSLLSKLSVRGVFGQLLRQSPPTGIRRWTFMSPLSAFGLRECLLEGGKTRVRWRCVCGRKMYDDFIELRPGAAADLEKWLNDSIRNHAVDRASNPSQDYTLRSSNASSAAVSGQRQTAGSDISLQPLSWTASTMPDSDKNGAVAIDVHLEKCWLLICDQPRRGPDSLLAQLDLSSKPSDKELFDGIKELHSSLGNTFTLQPVLKGVQTIRFVQFQLHKMARVDIRKYPDMPPETKRDEYLYEPCDLIPPVGENLMTHWFQHPEEAWHFPYAYSLFPKKRKGQLDVDLSQGPSVAWGIQIVEGWLGSRIWLLSLSLFLCGSLAFGICWTVLKHDIQGAFGVAAYIVAFLTLAVGAAQANFG